MLTFKNLQLDSLRHADFRPFSRGHSGTAFASTDVVGVRRIEDLVTWQLAVEFRDAVYEIVRGSDAARRDVRYRDQLYGAVSSTEANIVEGFHRNSAKQFVQFLSYARASHAEAEMRLKDGIARGYFRREDCEKALLLAKRCGQAILRLLQSLEPFTRG